MFIWLYVYIIYCMYICTFLLLINKQKLLRHKTKLFGPSLKQSHAQRHMYKLARVGQKIAIFNKLFISEL